MTTIHLEVDGDVQDYKVTHSKLTGLWYALAHCRRCGSSFSCGEWQQSTKIAVEVARAKLSSHEQQHHTRDQSGAR